MASKKSQKKLDIHRLFHEIERRARAREPVAKALVAIAEASAEQGASVNVSKLTGLPFSAELKRLEPWFASLWTPKAPPARCTALYFGIVEFEGGRYDFRLAALPGKRPDTEDWAFERSVSPEPERAGSEVLASLSSAAITSSAEARHVICLAYVALLAAHLSGKLAKKLGRKPIVAVGYDEGDFVSLGALRSDGSFDAPKPAAAAQAASLRGQGALYHVVNTRGKGGAWLLNSPKSPTDRFLPLKFGRTGKRIKPERYRVTIYKPGNVVDLGFTHSRLMIARKRIGDLLSGLDPKAIQRVPVDIEGVDEPFEIINILSIVPSKRLLLWSKKNRKPVSDAPLEKTPIALTGRTDSIVIVSRELAEALAAAGVTGTELVPLDESKL